MAQSIPREVLDRARRNAPLDQQSAPRFGTMAWRSQTIAGSIAANQPFFINGFFAIGDNSFGQLGLGAAQPFYSNLVLLPGAWDSVHCGWYSTIASSNNQHYFAGGNRGSGGAYNVTSFALISANITDPVAGAERIYALSGNNMVYSGLVSRNFNNFILFQTFSTVAIDVLSSYNSIFLPSSVSFDQVLTVNSQVVIRSGNTLYTSTTASASESLAWTAWPTNSAYALSGTWSEAVAGFRHAFAKHTNGT